mgnify:CR=1 FL=1
MAAPKSPPIAIDPFPPPERQESSIGNHYWDVSRLIDLAKELPVMDIPMVHLNFDHVCRELTLREMVGHIKSVLNADLSYPIILDEDGGIMDGRHRIMKALMDGERSIKAVRFTRNPPASRVE